MKMMTSFGSHSSTKFQEIPGCICNYFRVFQRLETTPVTYELFSKGGYIYYNKVKQLYVYIYPHIPSLLHLPPTLLSHPSRQSQSTELISLCYATASHQPSIVYVVVYICPCHSLTSSQLTLPPPCVLKSILYICIFIPVLPLGSSKPLFFFFQIPYVCASVWYLFFSF